MVAFQPGLGREDMVRPSRDGSRKGRCSNDYVQSWLEKTQRRPAWEPPNESPQDDEVPWRPHDLGVVFNTEMSTYPSSLRKRRGGSFDSSIIPYRPRQREHRALRTAISKRPSSARERRDRDELERPQSSITMSSVPRKHDTGPFEKRARYKTKPDRYERRKRKNTEYGDGRRKARRTRAPGKKNLVSSREVMDNFKSDAILADGRLTVKPALTPGLYGNARCGSRKELPDLAYNSMDFLAEAKRRDDRSERSSMETRGGIRKTRWGMCGSSPQFMPRSESSEPMRGECSGDKNAMYSLVWERSNKRIPVAPRPSTAPVEAGTIYDPPRRRGYRGPAHAGSSLDSRDFSVCDQSPPYGAEFTQKEAEDYTGSTPEPMRRLLWQTGVFDGLEPAGHSTTDVHQHLGRERERGSPSYQETATRTCGRVQCADKSTMATLPESGDYSELRLSRAPQPIAKAEGTRETDAAMSEYRLQARVESSHRRIPGLSTVHAAMIAPTGDSPVDRTKIALMAHIPVYCHQESQTELPWQVPQNPAYTHAGTQTGVSPTQNFGRCLVSGDARFSPAQQHGTAEELFLSGEPPADSDSPIWAPDDVDSRISRNHISDGRDEILSRLTNGCHQAHSARQQQISLESQGQLYAGRDGFEGPVPFPRPQSPSHPNGRDALGFVTPMENDTAFDEGSSHYPWEHDGYHAESQGAGVKRSNGDPAPVHRHKDRETRTYHPYPLHYMFDKDAAVQPFNTGEVELYPRPSAFRMLAEEPCSYRQEILYPSEPLPRPSRPGIYDPGRNDVPSCGRNRAEHIQVDNQVYMGGPPHVFAHQQQRTQDDLEQEHLEAYWRNRQLELARRYGY